MIIETTDINEARKQAQKLKKEGKEVIIKAKGPEFNRKILELKEVDMLLSPELHDRKDKLKERDSGLNEVLCNIAAKNSIKIGIDLGEAAKKPAKEKAIILSRIIQNIMLCKKTGAKIVLLNCKDKKAAFSLLLTLGASTKLAKEAIQGIS